ncbi:MAG: (2Fe-2S)-binding protein [Aquabacterium sp.]|nr:(2Fe-2S)-binding protein [Aquabacterium sp.]
MIVCVCHRISDRDIRRMAQQGCQSFDDLQIDSGVSTCCGRCEDCAREVVSQAKGAVATVAMIRKPDATSTSVK